MVSKLLIQKVKLCFSKSAIYYGVPTNFVSEWGERRQLSPNDACVIHCDLLAERERSMGCISRTYFRGGIAIGNVGALEGTTKNNRLINLLNQQFTATAREYLINNSNNINQQLALESYGEADRSTEGR